MSDKQASHLAILHQASFFQGLPEDVLEALGSSSRLQSFGRGATICRRGEEGPELYLILEGSVEVRQGARLLALIGEGEVLGEMAVLDNRPRSADLVAAEHTRLLCIPGSSFQECLDLHPSFTRKLLATLASRYREAASQQLQVDQLVRAYRERGHVIASLDPLGLNNPETHPELGLKYYGLDTQDLDTTFTFLMGKLPTVWPLHRIISTMRSIYCGAVGVQFMHIDDLAVQHWLCERLENPEHDKPLPRHRQLHILRKLTDAQLFEAFLDRNFARAKRFSLEGAETLIPLLDQAIDQAGELGVQEIVIGMAHRGRLNVLVNALEYPPHRIFRRFDKLEDRDTNDLDGDVRFHLGFETQRETTTGRHLHLSLCFNPSHLEAVGPVVLGRVRARQTATLQDQHAPDATLPNAPEATRPDTPEAARPDATDAGLPDTPEAWQHARTSILPLIIHGDAAFAGQGIVQESLNLSHLDGYRTGGTVHIILNNQIGFTTLPAQGRSTQYATDVARMLQIPIFHVNGERPEAVDRVIRLALEFRQRWQRDVVVDMYCYRRHGHMEIDDPSFTQPTIYQHITQRPNIRETYTANVLELGDIAEDEATAIADASQAHLHAELALAEQHTTTLPPGNSPPTPPPSQAPAPTQLPTSVTEETLATLLTSLVSFPDGFQPHPKLKMIRKRRLSMAKGKQRIDWATAEALAYATLLTEDIPIRLTGQDSERGTFGHRHAVLYDAQNGTKLTPLNTLSKTQATFEVHNSPLSEASVLAFEFGFLLPSKRPKYFCWAYAQSITLRPDTVSTTLRVLSRGAGPCTYEKLCRGTGCFRKFLLLGAGARVNCVLSRGAGRCAVREDLPELQPAFGLFCARAAIGYSKRSFASVAFAGVGACFRVGVPKAHREARHAPTCALMLCFFLHGLDGFRRGWEA